MKTLYFIMASLLFTLAACTNNTTNKPLTNDGASLPTAFNFAKLGLKVITSSINKKQHTMNILYGNALALKAAADSTTNNIPGEVLALVTWAQQADDDWYGAKIPANLLSVEMLKTKKGKNDIQYQRFDGKNLSLNADTTNQNQRISYMLAQKPSVMP